MRSPLDASLDAPAHPPPTFPTLTRSIYLSSSPRAQILKRRRRSILSDVSKMASPGAAAAAGFIVACAAAPPDLTAGLRVVVELGCGTGVLAHDFLEHCEAALPAFYAALHYVIGERSDALRALQARTRLGVVGGT